MNGLLPEDDNGIGDANKNKYYRHVGLASEIQSGKSKSFSISDERGKIIDVAVFNVDGQYYAISNTCIHNLGMNIVKYSLYDCISSRP